MEIRGFLVYSGMVVRTLKSEFSDLVYTVRIVGLIFNMVGSDSMALSLLCISFSGQL